MGRPRARRTTRPSVPAAPARRSYRRITTYPVRLTGPAPLTGKEIHVHRVALHQCLSCGHLMAGQAKVERCVERGIQLFLGLPLT